MNKQIYQIEYRKPEEPDTHVAVLQDGGLLVPLKTLEGTVYVISGDFDSVTDMVDALQDNRPVKIQQIGADIQDVRENQENEVEAMVRRIARTGILTWGGAHLEDDRVWDEKNHWRIPEKDIDEWLADPDQNSSRDRAYKLARRLLGIDDYEGQEPYLEETTVERVWNPDFPQNAVCDCGHPYHRHFDGYEDSYPIGCKYCSCNEWRKP